VPAPPVVGDVVMTILCVLTGKIVRLGTDRRQTHTGEISHGERNLGHDSIT